GAVPARADAPPDRPLRDGTLLPPIGLGTWQAFDIGPSEPGWDDARAALAAFVDGGGRVVDTSPMYGAAETVVGDLQHDAGLRRRLYLATKIWTRGEESGVAQLADSQRRLRAPVLDLVQVHNLLGIESHLRTLRAARDAGRVRHIGITHYTAAAHEALADWIAREPLDVVQVNYSLAEPEADRRLLDHAADRGVGVLVNRPLAEGGLIRRTRGLPLPAWAVERGVVSWAQYCLKWVIGHPAVTCALVGTRNPRHVGDNLAAASGWIPDAAERERMRTEFVALP
ncbi:MAG: aldo/keto reductase, partial [Xanthomonadaceae bacterium]|nr:aldo/keto reductase [Xanthomonadaceae bacterium]